MRTLSVLFLLVVFMASFASAETLTTANPIGQGRWAVLGSVVNTSDYDGTGTNVNSMAYGGYVGYGITSDLDGFIQLGTSSLTGLSPVVSANSITGYGGALKYRVMKEGANMPVSVAVAGQVKSIAAKQTLVAPHPAPGEYTMDGSQWTVGAGVSKVMIPFVPYAGLAYRSSGGQITESTQIDVTLGTAVAWSQQGAVMVEGTYSSITPTGGTNYNNGQVAAAVAYKI